MRRVGYEVVARDYHIGGPLDKAAADNGFVQRLSLDTQTSPKVTLPERRAGVEIVGHIRQPIRDRMHSRRHFAQSLFQRLARRTFQELVGIEGEHEIGLLSAQRFAHQRRDARRLKEFRPLVALDAQRQIFCLQLRQDVAGRIERPVVDDCKAIEDAQVVSHERLDHVGFVADHCSAERRMFIHPCTGPALARATEFVAAIPGSPATPASVGRFGVRGAIVFWSRR